MALGWDEPWGRVVAQSTDFGAWEREKPQRIDEVMGPETGGLMAGHMKGCVRRLLGLLGVVGPAWGRE